MNALNINPVLVTASLTFVAVLLLLVALNVLWQNYKGPAAQKIERRLRALGAEHDGSAQTALLKARMFSQVPLIDRLLLNVPLAQRLDHFVLQSGREWPVFRLLLASLLIGLLTLSALWALGRQPFLLALAVGVAVSALPWLYLARLRSQRLVKLEVQLPEALDLMGRALRSGHAFSSALQMVGDEMPDPIASEFRAVHDEVNFGVSLQQALTNLTERVPLTDLRYFVVSVLIQRDSGGNLTEVLGNLSRLIRERLKLLAKVRVLSSEGRLSAWILALMPFALAALMNIFNPKFMSPLWTDPIGIDIVKYMLLLMAFGVVMLRFIVRIRV